MQKSKTALTRAAQLARIASASFSATTTRTTTTALKAAASSASAKPKPPRKKPLELAYEPEQANNQVEETKARSSSKAKKTVPVAKAPKNWEAMYAGI